ncbi:MAG: class I SAM-dependent methyltransferase [Candidatus Micrarchaeota archaeon]|nr:class I SAM-dependent methyltransferase [Candidatus Micrarchaeota archaeon]
MPNITACRICGSGKLHVFLRLGPTPLANSFIKPERIGDPEPSYPLDVCLCNECGLVQLNYVVPPEVMFKDYIYFSSTSATMRGHFAMLASEVLADFAGKGSLVVEIASNDGVLLRNMLGKDVRILGVEPATNIALKANESGVRTLNDFFNSGCARKIRASEGPAKVVIANNVLAHVPDLKDFVTGVSSLLADDGVFIAEFPYLADLYSHLEFDTIYHEHLSYFSLKPIIRLFGQSGMELFDVKKQAVHGGTLRIYAQKKGGPRKASSGKIGGMLDEEKRLGLYGNEAYDKFASDVGTLRAELLALLRGLKKGGKKIAIYGAPAKGNTLLNYCKIGADLVEYAVDRSPYKQNHYTPGTHIMVYGPEKLDESKVDYLLILAWNMADEIMAQQASFKQSGGKFILPVPRPRIA